VIDPVDWPGVLKRIGGERGMRGQWVKACVGVLIVAGMPASVLVGGTALAGVPGSTSALNLDEKGLALGGYDPVAYFEGGKPVRGREGISASYGGARYLFATAAHRQTFLKEPEKFVPEFGGYCVVGAAFGEKVDVDPTTGQVVNGRLYLNNSRKALDIFNKDMPGIIAKAQDRWPAVKDKAL
jgi:YHS domain-containing protein